MQEYIRKRLLKKQNDRLRQSRLVAARKKGTHSQEEWDEMVALFDHTCPRCGASVNLFCKDHIIPIYQGGSDHISNIQPLCWSCNTGKSGETNDVRQAYLAKIGINMPNKWETV